MALAKIIVQSKDMGDPFRKPESVRPASRRPTPKIRKTGVAAEELPPKYSVPAPTPPPPQLYDGDATHAFDPSASAKNTHGENSEPLTTARASSSRPPPAARLPPVSAPPAQGVSPWTGAHARVSKPAASAALYEDESSEVTAYATPKIRPDADTESRRDHQAPNHRAPSHSAAEEWNETLTAVPREQLTNPRQNSVRPAWPKAEDDDTGGSLGTGDFDVEIGSAPELETVAAQKAPVKAKGKAQPQAQAAAARSHAPPPAAAANRPAPRRVPSVEVNIPAPLLTAPLPEPSLSLPRQVARQDSNDPYAAYRKQQQMQSPQTPGGAFARQQAAQQAYVAPISPRTEPPGGFRPVAIAPPPSYSPRTGVAKAAAAQPSSPRYLLWIAYGLLVGGFGVLFGAHLIATQRGDDEVAAPPPRTSATVTVSVAAQPPPAVPQAVAPALPQMPQIQQMQQLPQQPAQAAYPGQAPNYYPQQTPPNTVQGAGYPYGGQVGQAPMTAQPGYPVQQPPYAGYPQTQAPPPQAAWPGQAAPPNVIQPPPNVLQPPRTVNANDLPKVHHPAPQRAPAPPRTPKTPAGDGEETKADTKPSKKEPSVSSVLEDGL
jgi:hypothetical protein